MGGVKLVVCIKGRPHMLIANLPAWRWSSLWPYFLFFSLQHTFCLGQTPSLSPLSTPSCNTGLLTPPAASASSFLPLLEPSGPLLPRHQPPPRPHYWQRAEAQREAVHTGQLANGYSEGPGPLGKASSQHSQGVKQLPSTMPRPSFLDSGRETSTNQNDNTRPASFPRTHHTVSLLRTFACAILSA